jgi:hypothetical protein
MSILLKTLLWFIGSCIWGFIVSAVFSEKLKLSRRVYLIPYVVLTGVLVVLYFMLNNIPVFEILKTNWIWGIVAGVLVSAFLVKTVFNNPKSRETKGWHFVWDLVWIGIAYGLIDALFLNVMPVVMVNTAIPTLGWIAWLDTLVISIIALSASLLITLIYHLGYGEFRNKSVIMVLVGNTLITLAFIVTGSPLGAIISHTVMHIAAAVVGPETTIQLPPHRDKDLNKNK